MSRKTPEPVQVVKQRRDKTLEALVESILGYFTEATGATIKYASSETYEQQIVIDTEA